MAKMASYKEKAIVIKSRPFGEADKLVILFGLERGKFSALAKGARRVKSKFGARLEPFTYADFFLAQGKNLSIVSQIETIELFTKVRAGLGLNAAMYLIRQINSFTEEGQPSHELFYLLLDCLKLLKDGIRPDIVVAIFLVKLAQLEGFTPEWEECVVCRKPAKELPEKIKFTLKHGGLLCSGCISDNSFLVLPKKVAHFSKKIYTVDVGRLKKISLDDKLASDINDFYAKYLAYSAHLEPIYYDR
jgi:DNA repair protein RecO (recombination protein O)